MARPRITRIFLSKGHDFKGRHGKDRLHHAVRSVEEVECIAGKGLVGDRFFGYKEDFKGQLTFIDENVISDVIEKLGNDSLEASAFRRNIVVSGIDLNQLIGKRFLLDGVELSGSEECAPCYWMNRALGDGAEGLLKDRGGLRCRILSSGALKIGECDLTVLD